MFKSAAIISLGTLFEWAEFTFFGYSALFFSHIFFSNVSEGLSLLAALGAFAVSYLARPIGGVLFGLLGDRFGRNSTLSISIVMMGLVTLGMACLPTYRSFGIYAPILLLILRFLQGIAVSGEFTNAAIYLVEHAKQRPIITSSLVPCFAALGMVLGALAATIVALPMMPIWVWRIPLFFGFIICMLGCYLRAKLLETPAFLAITYNDGLSMQHFKRLLKKQCKGLLQVFMLSSFISTYIYICNIWWPTFVRSHHYFATYYHSHIIATCAELLVVPLIPLFAYFASNSNQRWWLRVGIIGAILLSPLLFWSTAHKYFALVIASQVLYAICNALMSAVLFNFLIQKFPVHNRCTCLAVGWNLAVATLGGTAPLVAQLLISYTQYPMSPGLYISVIGFITLFVI